VLEDQLGLELSFMAHLARKAVLKAREGDEQALSDVLDRQEKFLREHLLNWVPRLCADIRACPGSDFYKAVSLVTEGFLRQEETFLCEN
jgi:anaerobic sulfite reductase subunit A